MIFVDTSVWIYHFRHQAGQLTETLNWLLDQGKIAVCAPVRIELLYGVAKESLSKIYRLISDLPQFYPRPTTWEIVDQWIVKGTLKRWSFTFSDILIGAIVHENQAQLWSLDKDFQRMAELKLFKLFEPKKL